jgi:hypothetical protein
MNRLNSHVPLSVDCALVFGLVTPACHAVSACFASAGQGAGNQHNGRLGVTVTDRWIPLVPAPSGTRVARLARTTVVQPGGLGVSSAAGLALVLDDYQFVAKPS